MAMVVISLKKPILNVDTNLSSQNLDETQDELDIALAPYFPNMHDKQLAKRYLQQWTISLSGSSQVVQHKEYNSCVLAFLNAFLECPSQMGYQTALQDIIVCKKIFDAYQAPLEQEQYNFCAETLIKVSEVVPACIDSDEFEQDLFTEENERKFLSPFKPHFSTETEIKTVWDIIVWTIDNYRPLILTLRDERETMYSQLTQFFLSIPSKKYQSFLHECVANEQATTANESLDNPFLKREENAKPILFLLQEKIFSDDKLREQFKAIIHPNYISPYAKQTRALTEQEQNLLKQTETEGVDHVFRNLLKEQFYDPLDITYALNFIKAGLDYTESLNESQKQEYLLRYYHELITLPSSMGFSHFLQDLVQIKKMFDAGKIEKDETIQHEFKYYEALFHSGLDNVRTPHSKKWTLQWAHTLGRYFNEREGQISRILIEHFLTLHNSRILVTYKEKKAKGLKLIQLFLKLQASNSDIPSFLHSCMKLLEQFSIEMNVEAFELIWSKIYHDFNECVLGSDIGFYTYAQIIHPFAQLNKLSKHTYYLKELKDESFTFMQMMDELSQLIKS